MSLFAIADLHLSHVAGKTMSLFGEHWNNHSSKIKKNWEDIVTHQDTVIVAGDISWATKFNDAIPDLKFIDELPGSKLLIKGNHDYWWGSVSKMNSMFGSMTFLKDEHIDYNGIALCGTRGWISPNDTFFKEKDRLYYDESVKRLYKALSNASSYETIFLFMHYPPTNDKTEPAEYINIIKEFPVKKVIYGHLHGEEYYRTSFLGVVDDVEYTLVSSDYTSFRPILISK